MSRESEIQVILILYIFSTEIHVKAIEGGRYMNVERN